MGLFNFFRRSRILEPTNKVADRVFFDDQTITHVRADGKEESIRWDDLDEVGIVTTDSGPLLEDVFFLLLAPDKKSGCAIPQISSGCDKLLERLQKLPDFDNAAVIQAMGSTSNARFVCWKR